MNGVGKVVCVTGGSGFIASWLVKLLLARGYVVHATVRSLDDPEKTQHLLAFDGAKERLSLFEANLNEEGSFDSAVNGCECVFHTASPVLLSVNDPQVELIDPAVKGTLNVLKSAAKVPSITRVVLTSSMATVAYGVKFPEFSDVVDETWFSDRVTCEQIQIWYLVSKIMAEDAATKFSKPNHLELVILNPGLVIGPLLQPTLNFTSECFLSLIKTGKEFSHILAFENPKANGRYCIVGNVVRYSEITKIVDVLYPTLRHSARYNEEKYDAMLPYNVSKAKVRGLGVEFTPMDVSIRDTIESFKEKNLVSF